MSPHNIYNSGSSGKGPGRSRLWGQMPTVSWTEHMRGEARSSLFAALIFPCSKGHPSTAAITETFPVASVTDSNPQSYALKPSIPNYLGIVRLK